MTLYQIFFWFLKLNDVSYELRSLYNSNPQYNYKDYYTNNNNNLFITIKSLHDFFDERVSEYHWGTSQIQWIFDDILGYNHSRCSSKLVKAIKKWARFVKNVELSNKLIRAIPIFDIKRVNGEEPLFYIRYKKKIYNGAEQQ